MKKFFGEELFLNSEAAGRIYAKIREISKSGMTVVLVEQDTNRAIRTAEYTTVMLKGKTVLSGRSKELGEDEIKAAYFGL